MKQTPQARRPWWPNSSRSSICSLPRPILNVTWLKLLLEKSELLLLHSSRKYRPLVPRRRSCLTPRLPKLSRKRQRNPSSRDPQFLLDLPLKFPLLPMPLLCSKKDQESSNEVNSLERAEWNAVEITRVLWKKATTPREVSPTDFVLREIEEQVEKYMKKWEEYLTQDRQDRNKKNFIRRVYAQRLMKKRRNSLSLNLLLLKILDMCNNKKSRA